MKHAIEAGEITAELIGEIVRAGSEAVDKLLNGTPEAKHAHDKAIVDLKKKTKVSDDKLKEANELLATKEGRELVREKLDSEEGKQQLAEYLQGGGCASGGGRQGFNWSPWQLFITPAHAEAATLTVCAASGPPGWLVAAGIVVVGGIILCYETACLSRASDKIGSILHSESNGEGGRKKKTAKLPADTAGTPPNGYDPHGLGPAPQAKRGSGVNSEGHTANVTVRDANGNIVTRTRFESRPMTAAEKGLGIGRSRSAVHTEARNVRTVELPKGGTMRITGFKKPCTNCRGAMDITAKRSQGRIIYQWRDKYGVTQKWIRDYRP